MKDRMLRTSLYTLLGLFALLAAVQPPQPAGAQGGTCIDDITGRTNVCSANDVQISYLVNELTTTCVSGEPVTLHLTARLVGTSAERYDIGIFLALDGGDAASGSCHHDYLRPPLAAGGTCTVSGDDCKKDADCPAGETCTGGYNPGSPGVPGGPFYDAEPGDDPDECGDLEQGVNTYYRLSPVTVACIDSDGDGLLDMSTAVSWDNQRTNTCQNVGGAVPNTPSKCRYGTVDVANVTVIVTPGEIQVQKTAEPTQLTVPGGPVEFTFVVENPSPTIVTLESLVDSVYGPLEEADGDCTVPQTLGPADTYVCSISAQVLGSPGVYENTVTASGTDANQDPVSDTDTASVTIVSAPPGDIQVQKTAEPTQLAEPGGPVEFTFVVENPSPTTVILESLVDSVYGPLEEADGDCAVPQTLGPADTYVCSISAQVLGSPGVYENTVTASGTDANQDPVSDTDTASVTIVSAPPGDIQVQKTAEPTQLLVPGGPVEFTFAVENPSSITITLESLVDSVYGPLEEADGDCTVPQTLGPADTYVCSISAQVLGSPGVYENTVTASGIDWNQDPVSDTDTASVTIVSAPPGDIQVQKTAEPTQLTEPGGPVEFTFVVENPSSITVTLESLVDSVYGPLEEADGDCAVPQTLGPADTYVCSISAQVLGSPGIYENAVTASGVDWNQDPVSDTDTASVMIVMEPPETGVGPATATIIGAIAAGGLALLAAGAALRRKTAS